MDGKEIKSLLKQAREAIKEKDFKTALKHCKAVLKVDKSNYNAWVFVGAAAQEIDQLEQSEAAFKRAIEISPDQLLAWQGLCSFYEKHKKKENVQELLSVYKKLLDLLDSDKDKKIEIHDKLILCMQTLGDSEKTTKVLKSKLDLVKGDCDLEFQVQKQIFQELCGKSILTSYEKDSLIEALQTMVEHKSFSENDCDRIFSTCIEVLQKSGNHKYCLSLALCIYQKYPNNASCVEFLCRTAMNTYLESGSVVENLDEIILKMKNSEAKGINAIFQGFVSFLSKNYIIAIQLCNEGLKTLEYCLQGWYFLSLSQLNLYQFKDSIKSCKSGIDICIKSKAPEHVIGKFYLLLGQGLCGRQNYDTAINAIEKSIGYLGLNKETLLVLCSTLLKIGLVEKAEKMYQDLRPKLDEDAEVLQFEGHLYLLKKDFTNALATLRKSVALTESPYTLHLVGLVLWENNQRDKAFKIFSKAVELDPYLSLNFLYLGHYYEYELQDKSKACVCYQRAFTLDNTDIEIGMSLSQVLKDLGREDENMRILKIITEQVSFDRCKWAWTQLGLCQLQKNLSSEAIFSLQNAVRADPSSSYGWECLADAYLKRGSYESALKAFEKSSEINPKAMYPLYQIATIQKMRGFFVEAIEKYKNLLNVSSTYVPALIGLSETLTLLAKKCFSECLYGLSRDYCQEALYTLARVAASNNSLSCLWKLAGDACTIPYNFDDAWLPIIVPADLHQHSEENISCEKRELLAFGSKFYGLAITKKNISSLWHDLGTNYYYQSKTSISEPEGLDFIKRAFICFQKAISISPNYELHWTALGVVALGNDLKDFAFGQHAFIKSLNINKNNAETWTNLGILYLLHDNIELANAVFRKAQSTEPTYPLSWIGQAIIADKVKHTETVDLYRHATTLGSHAEAILGYPRVICQALINIADKDCDFYKYNIELMNAVVTAADCSIKFTANQTGSPEAFNILGMLLERQGIYAAAVRAFKRALELLQKSGKADDIEAVRSNYARALCSIGLVDEAIKEFMMLKTINVSILCSFARAFYKTKQYGQALKLLKQAFKISTLPDEKSHLLVAMAVVARNMGAEGPNPLTLLYESSQMKPASVPGLLALCACGILKEDWGLTLAAQKELSSYKYNKKYCTYVSFLEAAQAFIQKGAYAGRNELQKSVHYLPNNGAMWLQMASCLLQWHKPYASNAALCTKIGSFHGGRKETASQVFALCQISIGYRKDALFAAQKAVHINPGNLSNWITLAAACHVAEKDRKDTGWIFSFVKKLAKDQGGIKPHLLGALVILEAFHYIASEKMSEAEVLISKAMSIPSFSSETQSALQILDAVVKVFTNNGNLESLVIAIKKNPKLFLGWHILSQLLLSSEKISEAEKTISQFAVTAEKIFPKWAMFPLLQLAALSYKAMHINCDEREKWLKLGEEVTGKAVHMTPNSQAARFLQGLFALESGNINLARRSFEKVLSCSSLKEPKWIEKIASEIIEAKNLKRKGKSEGSC